MKRLEHTVLILKGHSCQCQLMCFIRSEYALYLSLWLKISSHLQCAVVWNYACPSMWNTSECQMIYFQLESSSASFKLDLFGSKCLFSKTYTRVILVLLAGRFNWTFLYQFCATCSRNKRCIFSLISNFLAVSIDLEDTTGCFHGCHTVFAQFFFPLLSGDRTSLFMWWYPPRGSDHLRLYTQVRSVGSCHQLSVSLMNSSRLTDRWVIGRE